MRDPKTQDFLEDLAAVYVKHGLCLDSGEAGVQNEPLAVIALNPEFRWIAMTRYGLRFQSWDVASDYEGRCAVRLPTTGHGRLSAMARVAALRAAFLAMVAP